MSTNSEEKSEQASKRKLRKQREQGTLPRTSDLASILNVIVAVIILAASARHIVRAYSEMFVDVFVAMSQPWDLAQAAGGNTLVHGLFEMTIAIVLGTLGVLILVVTIYQGGLPISLHPILPDFARLNPGQGLARIFGRRTWIEAGFHLSRVLIWFVVCALALWTIWPSIFYVDLCGLTCGLEIMEAIVWRLLSVTILVLLVFLGLEMLVQRSLYLHEQKMSKSDVKRENKEQTGAPELRRERNRIRNELAKEAENADKSLSNMCFYYADVVVGLRYHPQLSPIPRVVAKATGEDAVHLRRYLAEKGNPSMAHEKIAMACARVAVGAPIGKDLFEDLAWAMSKLFEKNKS